MATSLPSQGCDSQWPSGFSFDSWCHHILHQFTFWHHISQTTKVVRWYTSSSWPSVCRSVYPSVEKGSLFRVTYQISLGIFFLTSYQYNLWWSLPDIDFVGWYVQGHILAILYELYVWEGDVCPNLLNTLSCMCKNLSK